MSDSDADEAAGPRAPRRRLEVPGVLAIADHRLPARRDPPRPPRTVHWLVLGAGAGVASPDELADWKRTAHFVTRESLDEAMRRAHGVVLPENALDVSDTPGLVALAARAPLIEVDEATYTALIGAGARGHVVSGIRTASGYGHASGAGRTVETSTDDWSRVSGTGDASDLVSPSSASATASCVPRARARSTKARWCWGAGSPTRSKIPTSRSTGR